MADEVKSNDADLPRRCADRALRLLPNFNRWVQAQVQREQLGGELSLRQLTVLYLIREETPTLGYIARRLMVTPAVVTGIVDRLERRGYVQRQADSDDRRVIRLALTETGRAQSVAVQQHLTEAVAARLSAHPMQDVESLFAGLALLDRVLAADLDGGSTATNGIAPIGLAADDC